MEAIGGERDEDVSFDTPHLLMEDRAYIEISLETSYNQRKSIFLKL